MFISRLALPFIFVTLGKGSSVWIREVMMMQEMFSISNVLLLEGYNHKIFFFCGS